MKKFFKEFKTFITRGNVLDMAVGVIIGGAFTAIVTALTTNILQPIINWLLKLILGRESLSDIYTFLVKVMGEDGKVDLANSIYIDWGAFINAIINFLLIAFILFCIVKTFNDIQANNKKLFEGKPTKEEKAELKKRGFGCFDKKALDEYRAEKKAEADKKAKEEAEKAAAEAEEAAKNSTEGLLKQILAELKKEDK